jgi:hypothetical protein
VKQYVVYNPAVSGYPPEFDSREEALDYQDENPSSGAYERTPTGEVPIERA